MTVRPDMIKIGSGIFPRIADEDGEYGYYAQGDRVVQVGDDVHCGYGCQPGGHKQLGPVWQESLDYA